MSRRTFGGNFFLWEHQEWFINSGFLVINLELFFQKTSGQIFKTALGPTRVALRGETTFLQKCLFFLKLEFLGYRRKLFRFLSKKRIGGVILLWFLCVKSRILKKDGSFKTVKNLAVFFRRRTKTLWVFPEYLSWNFKAGFCLTRSTFSWKIV